MLESLFQDKFNGHSKCFQETSFDESQLDSCYLNSVVIARDSSSKGGYHWLVYICSEFALGNHLPLEIISFVLLSNAVNILLDNATVWL